MKIKFTLLGLMLSALLVRADATNTYSLSPNAAIPDGNPVGLMLQTNVSGVAGTISSVTVTLDILGGFNGNLYAYLAGPQGQLAVLLNRPGVTAGNAFGYSDSGFSITLDSASLNNIHGYGDGYSLNGSGQVTGTWAPDGRAIDPQFTGAAFDAAPTTNGLALFAGGNANGLWTFFIADMGVGGVANMNNLSISIVTVPEPSPLALLGLGLGGMVCIQRLRRNSQRLAGTLAPPF
jgi:subtilisin-like proprotein convertase family protein